MKKGNNIEYDEIRTNLFELKFKIEFLRRDPSKIQELNKCMQEAEECLSKMKQIEFESINNGRKIN